MTLLANDATARVDSLDITRSLIVQAPAGSGKTTLLIQRYLRLLAAVDEPEAILAMTFTRKAAGEMLARVEQALAKAAPPESPWPHDPSKRHTGLPAQAALHHAAFPGWPLQDTPGRPRPHTHSRVPPPLSGGSIRWGEETPFPVAGGTHATAGGPPAPSSASSSAPVGR